MATLTQRREAIATALRTELASEDLYVYPRWPDQLVLPALIVWPTRMSGPVTLDGAQDIDLDLVLLVAEASQDNERGQEKLDDFLSGDGPDLITDAVDEHPELRLAVDGWQDYGIQELGPEESGWRFWGVRFPCTGLG